MKTITLFLLLSLSGALACLDIYEDTVWTPEESPYDFYENVYVHSGATLTVLPGTIVRFQCAYADGDAGFIQHNGVAMAKMMYVDGRIVAVGTAEEPVVFTGIETSPHHRWGCIYCSPSSQNSVFLYCRFERALYNSGSEWYIGAITCNHCIIRVEHCSFTDCWNPLYILNMMGISGTLFLYDNHCTQTEEELYCLYYSSGYEFLGAGSVGDYPHIIIARNNFNNTATFFRNNVGFSIDQVYNYLDHVSNRVFDGRSAANEPELEETSMLRDRDEAWGPVNAYGNYMVDSRCIIGGSCANGQDTVYVRKNTVIRSHGPRTSIQAYDDIVIADNVCIDGAGIYTDSISNALIYNNMVINQSYHIYSLWINGPAKAWNNIFYNTDPLLLSDSLAYFANNIVYNTISPCLENFQTNAVIENNILFNANGSIVNNTYYTNYPLFRNNWTNNDVLQLITDGGGNIIGTDPCLADTAAYDFTLLPDSPCIDAGYADSLLAAFDGLYNARVADGDSNGTAQIDIGAWELGATSYGSIEGYVYRSDGVTPLDVAKLTLSGCLPEWSDSTGYFRFDCGPGTYSLTAWHYYYEDQQSQLITVGPGEIVFVDIVMTGDAVATPEQLLQPYLLQSANYPNPFNPVTTIRYSIPADGRVELSVYNVRGQLVKRLVSEPQTAGAHSVQWEGRDANNRAVSSGVYFYRLKSGGHSQVRKMLLLK